MAQAAVNGLRLEYETFGARGASPILLIMGLGAQMTIWPDRFCQRLADAGHYVIRFDNRDVGLSTQLDEMGKPALMRASLAYKLGRPVRAGYTLDDMAEDAIGLLDALGIERAHVIGASMGGMIAQILAARFGHRLQRLVLLMTNSGSRRIPGPSLKVGLRMLRRPTTADRATLVEHSLQTWKLVASPAWPLSDDERRNLIERQFDRAHRPRGAARQLAAMLASGDRTPLLSRITAPTLVIHGEADCLVPVQGGQDLAARIAGARLETIPGMGHDLPEPLLEPIAGLVLGHLQAIDAPSLTPALAPRPRTALPRQPRLPRSRVA